MLYDNIFEFITAGVLSMIPQLGVLGPKAQDLVIPFCLGGGEPLAYFHLRALAIRGEIVLIRYEIGHNNNLTGKYIM